LHVNAIIAGRLLQPVPVIDDGVVNFVAAVKQCEV
jgi:hypothetical protein